MIVNEKDAAEKVCPIFVIARCAAKNNDAVNCIGSRCMWWRPADPHRQHENDAHYCGIAYSVRLP